MAAERVVIRIYNQHIKALSVEERLQLLALVAGELAGEAGKPRGAKQHDIRELRGLGKEIWDGIDAREYVNRLRDEWEKPA